MPAVTFWYPEFCSNAKLVAPGTAVLLTLAPKLKAGEVPLIHPLKNKTEAPLDGDDDFLLQDATTTNKANKATIGIILFINL